MTRDHIVTEARSWIGTPYCHQASLKGAGCDCLGLVRGVWRAVIGREPELPPPYTPDWAEALGEETLLAAARRQLIERVPSAARAGDVLIFRMGMGVPAKHCGVMSAPDAVIHAYWGRSVTETRLSPWWSRRVVAAFAFPGLED
ncbi:MAG: NlpC/P60 family protein [Hyphomonas sp.]|nr:NlpC/P60 family protein [Hyphomonas sp.]